MQDVLFGNWNQLRGQIKIWWGKLTDDDLLTIEGRFDKLVGVIQEKYNYTKQQAEQEVNRRLMEFEQGHRAAIPAQHR